MSTTTECVPCCTFPESVSIPGIQGQSAFTVTTGFAIPPKGNNVTIFVSNTDWMGVGETIFIPGAGLFEVVTIVDSTHVTLQYLNIDSNTEAGNAVAAGTLVTPGGAPGSDGTDGGNAFTLTTAGFVVPAANANVSNPDGFVHVASTAWMGVGQNVFISDGTDFGTFQVISITNSAQFVAKYLSLAGEAAPGVTIGSGATVSPGGSEPTLAVALPTVITDNSTGSATNTIAAGAGVSQLEIPHTFIGGTAAVEPVTTLVLGYKFKILSWSFVTHVLLVGAAGSRVANMEINAVDVGTVPSTVTIPIANAAVGAVTSGTAVAGANTGSASDSFSIEIASGGTAFTAGSGTFIIVIQNMDTADSIATLSAHVNSLIASLT